MTTSSDDLRLASEFPPATQDDWKKLVDGVLKGAEAECKALKDEIKRRGLLEAAGDSFAIRADPVFAGGLHNHGFAHGKDFAVGEIASHFICRPLCHFNHVRRQDRDVR